MKCPKCLGMMFFERIQTHTGNCSAMKCSSCGKCDFGGPLIRKKFRRKKAAYWCVRGSIPL